MYVIVDFICMGPVELRGTQSNRLLQKREKYIGRGGADRVLTMKEASFGKTDLQDKNLV